MLTGQWNMDSGKPPYYIVKCVFTWVYIIFVVTAKNLMRSRILCLKQKLEK